MQVAGFEPARNLIALVPETSVSAYFTILAKAESIGIEPIYLSDYWDSKPAHYHSANSPFSRD